jgi:glycosyltransferase involved in cell wall biosynthesis
MTGLAQSIKRYLAIMSFLGHDVVAIEAQGNIDAEQVLAFVGPDDFLLFNSLGIIERSDFFYQIATAWPCNRIAVYLHETEYTLDGFKDRSPSNYTLYRRAASSVSHFTVSEKQRDLLKKTYGINDLHLVYETTRLSMEVTTRSLTDPGHVMILMVGTVQRRKGAELFSHLSDLALRLGKPFRFFWVGQKLSEADTLYLSENVTWVGKMEGKALEEYIRLTDLFFLASEDDPMPLAALEAIDAHKPVVCYEKTGTEELVRNLAGCAVYREHTPEAALAAIEMALSAELDLDGLSRITHEISDEIAFSGRMTAAINAVFTGEG